MSITGQEISEPQISYVELARLMRSATKGRYVPVRFGAGRISINVDDPCAGWALEMLAVIRNQSIVSDLREPA